MKRQFIGLIIFGVLVIIFQLSMLWYQSTHVLPPPDVFFNTEKDSDTPLVLAEFNPNDFDEKQWRDLGFSEKQVATILKYKQVVGGQFLSKEQFKKCYAVSPDKYAILEPYILLPENNYEAKSGNLDFKKFTKKEIKVPGKFNPDSYSINDWIALGFSENQANAILKYKNYLGGSFVSKEKFKQCFIISDDNYRKLAPYLLLPIKSPENFQNYARKNYDEKSKISYKPFDPNILDLQGWKSLGFSEKQAAVIVNYRERNLRGSFKSLEDIQKCFVINRDKYEEMKPFIRLNAETMKTVNATTYASKDTESAVPEIKTDFSKIDLNQITYKQLREFGFTEKDAAMLLSFRKKLGGFVNRNQVMETYEIDQVLAQKLSTTSVLNSASVPKYTLIDAPEEWLKNHPYFKYSADKIIYYRITNPDERKIWKFIKVKPEYESKMRLYLK